MFDSFSLSPFLAILAAILFGAVTNVIKRGMAYVDAQTASVISIAATLLCYLALSPFWISWEELTSPAILLFALIGLIQPVISRYFSYEANRRVGPTVSATFTSTTPLIAATIAVLFLDESLSFAVAIGTLTTVFGVMIVSWNFQGERVVIRGAMLFAFATSFIRALATNISRFGMTILPNPLLGALVSFHVSFLGSVIIYYFQKGHLPSGMPRKGLMWCGLAGVISAAAVLSMYNALLLGSVLTVTPLLSTAPIFTLLFAFLFRQESPTRRTVAGVLLVVSGVIFVILRPN